MARKNKPFLFLLLLATALLLGGCNTLPKQDFNVKANTDIKKIGVIINADTEEYSVILLHHPGVSFGLIGGLVAAADMSSKADTFTAAVKLSKQQVLNELRRALRGLEQGGRYKIEFLQMVNTEPAKMSGEQVGGVHQSYSPVQVGHGILLVPVTVGGSTNYLSYRSAALGSIQMRVRPYGWSVAK